jgi:hypothetical protein
MHSGMYGGGACARRAPPPPPRSPGAKISVGHGGGMFAAAVTIIMSNEPP